MLWNSKWFPGTNLQDINLDWILKKVSALRGGLAGQYLYKKSDKDFDFGWKAGGGGGENGVTFYPTVSNAGIISWTNDGDLPNPTPVNINGPAGADGIGVPAGGSTGQILAKKSNSNYDTEWVNGSGGGGGENGVTFYPTVSSAGIISWTNDGDLPNPEPVNIKGPQGNNGTNGTDGDNGVTFTPSVSSAGVISWTNDGGLPNPTSVDIKGPTGAAGQGVPTGGSTGQILAKKSNSNYDTEWVNASGGGGGVPAGGSVRQVLTKTGAGDYVTGWSTIHLYLSFSIATSPYTYNDAAITSTMRVTNIEFTNPSAVVGNVFWVTNNGSLTLTATLSGSTYVEVDLAEY